jgi:hypothetical protein
MNVDVDMYNLDNDDDEDDGLSGSSYSNDAEDLDPEVIFGIAP